MSKPSDKYYEALKLTQRHHDGGAKTFSGQFTWKNRHRIKEIIDTYDVRSILDYGCGRGKQYRNIDDDTGQTLEQYWGLTTTKYDPGVKDYAKEPQGKFDLVLCVQVLGSIPYGDLPWVVDRLYGLANKAIFVSERLGLPRKQIYASIKDDMPYGLSREEWVSILRRPDKPIVPRMLLSIKNETGWEEPEWINR